MRLDGTPDDTAAGPIRVGDRVRYTPKHGSSAAVMAVVRSIDAATGRYTVARVNTATSDDSTARGRKDSDADLMKAKLLDHSREVTSTSDTSDAGAGAAEAVMGGGGGGGGEETFTALAEELEKVADNSNGGGGLSEPLLGGSAAVPEEANCWIVLCGKCASWCRSMAKEEVDRERRRSSINMLDGADDVAIVRKGTPLGSIFNLCNCMLGVGVLALPSAFSRVGVVLGLLLLVACAVLVLCVFQLINLSLSLCPNATTYSGLLVDR
eukprot:COSAG06_NODE_10721_length_1629_cov_143.977124_1_plen_267_part_00